MPESGWGREEQKNFERELIEAVRCAEREYVSAEEPDKAGARLRYIRALDRFRDAVSDASGGWARRTDWTRTR